MEQRKPTPKVTDTEKTKQKLQDWFASRMQYASEMSISEYDLGMQYRVKETLADTSVKVSLLLPNLRGRKTHELGKSGR